MSLENQLNKRDGDKLEASEYTEVVQAVIDALGKISDNEVEVHTPPDMSGNEIATIKVGKETIVLRAPVEQGTSFPVQQTMTDTSTSVPSSAAVISALRDLSTFGGMATPTSPTPPKSNFFYFANTAGKYDNFDGSELEDGNTFLFLQVEEAWTHIAMSSTGSKLTAGDGINIDDNVVSVDSSVLKSSDLQTTITDQQKPIASSAVKAELYDPDGESKLSNLSAKVSYLRYVDATDEYLQQKTMYYKKMSSTSTLWTTNETYYWRLIQIPPKGKVIFSKFTNRTGVRMVIQLDSSEDFAVGGSLGINLIDVDAPNGEYEIENHGDTPMFVAWMYKYSNLNFFTLKRPVEVSVKDVVDSLAIEVDSHSKAISSLDGLKSTMLVEADGEDAPMYINPSTRGLVRSNAWRVRKFVVEGGLAYKAIIHHSGSTGQNAGFGLIYGDIVEGNDLDECYDFRNFNDGGTIELSPASNGYFVFCHRMHAYPNASDNVSLYVYDGDYLSVDEYLDEKLSDVKEELTQQLNVHIPDVVFCVPGTELTLWNENVSLSVDRGLQSPINYHVQWDSPIGKVVDRGLRINPTVNDLDAGGSAKDYDARCYIYSTAGKFISSKSFTIRVCPQSMTSVKHIVFAGASTGTGTVNAALSNFNDPTRYTGSNIPVIHNVSKGGWHWGTFTSAGADMYRVQVSNVGALSVGAKYKDANNNGFKIEEVNITHGAGNLLISKLYEPSSFNFGPLTIPSGTLTKASSHAGDSSFAYTNGSVESSNPFWNPNTNQLDIAYFRSTNNISANIDAVIFQLGINSSGDINVEGLVENRIIQLYEAFIADNQNVKVILGFPAVGCSLYSGIGSNYGGDSQSWGLKFATNMYKFRELYFRMASEYPNIEVMAHNLNCDRYYGYQLATRPVSDRCNETETYCANYVHQSSVGYAQMGDAVFAGIIGLMSE